MTDTPLKDFRADNSINTDDDLKIGVLADGLASGSVHAKNVDFDATSHRSIADGNNITSKIDAKETGEDNHPSVSEPPALDDTSGFGNVGIATDVTFNLGDDLSFSLNLDRILDHSLSAVGNDTGFTIVQANSLADQDHAYSVKMNNANPDNASNADGGHAESGDGMHFGTSSDWDLKVGHEVDASAKADASVTLASGEFHQEIVQGANLLSNAVDVNVVGGDLDVTSTGQDSDG
ncbi:fibrinogen-binding protein [Sinorhizobium garamanticum]|uniref:Fibrinogen-binding protein n=1 Tax=Sinorhizobium garamanticum TaxID=680247 RepID=A0ABY8DDX5_9HYPH|nr:fibrinogen-binding protein [Sinorhizobium garamanticum]WEX89069.1 fibrinogen-binding protein [Sinorhizobium garamanticum]